jgi:hypothetical protein
MSSFARGLTEALVGAGLIVLGIFATPLSFALLAKYAAFVITTGAGLVLSGIGTMLQKGPLQGLSTTTRNPIAAWNVVYGRSRVGGVVIYLETTGESDKYLHMVIMLACHPCQSVDSVLFDGKRVCLDTSGNSLSFDDSTAIIASQQTQTISSIARLNNVVTVVLTAPMPLPAASAAGPAIADGDQIDIHDVPGDLTLNGTYAVKVVNSTTFTYVCSGIDSTVTSAGHATTTWPDYGDTVHLETLLGNHTATFPGLVAGGDSASQGLWTVDHKLLGKTSAYLRLKYGGNTYVSGLPTIAFTLHGKNDIYDPRPSPPTHGYSENSALCIADYLAQPSWGFKAQYGTEIPLDRLGAAANICDEPVDLATGGTEPRYACNGGFQLTTKRGEVLQNLLTSCGGRLVYTGGQFIIHPAAWEGTAFTIGEKPVSSATIYVTTENIPSLDAYDAYTDVTVGPDALGSASLNIVYDKNYAKRVDSRALRPEDIAAGIGTIQLYCRNFETALITSTDQIRVLIYDCYLIATHPDGSTTTYRPTAARIEQPEEGHGHISNPELAIDGDASTCATIARWHFNPLNDWNIVSLVLYAFAPVGATDAPDLTPSGVEASKLALAIAAGPFSWKSRVPVRDLYNGVKGTFISPSNNWQSSDFPAYAQDTNHGYASGSPIYPEGDANLAADGGDRRWLDIQLPFTISSATAQRLAKIELLRRRQQGTGTFSFNMTLYKATALDIVQFTLPVLGWNGKRLEVAAHRFTLNKGQASGSDQEVTVLGTELDLQETDPAIYDWSAGEELLATGGGYSKAPNLPTSQTTTQNVPAPTGVTAVSNAGTAIVGGDGIQRSRILVSWALPTDGYVLNGGRVEVQYQLVASPTAAWTGLPTVDAGAVTQLYIDSVTDGQSYLVRLRNLNVNGAVSNWVQAGPVLVSGADSTIPPSNIGSGGASPGNVLVWNGSDWVPGSPSGGGSVNFVRETPAGTLNGTNKVFTLTYAPSPTGSLVVYLNGVEQVPTTDYTISGATITFIVAPKTGDLIIAQYTH